MRRLELHEAWLAIAEAVVADSWGTWICNEAEYLRGRGRISAGTELAILLRVDEERERQNVERDPFGIHHIRALWRSWPVGSTSARVARLKFIAAELRRLAVRR